MNLAGFFILRYDVVGFCTTIKLRLCHSLVLSVIPCLPAGRYSANINHCKCPVETSRW